MNRTNFRRAAVAAARTAAAIGLRGAAARTLGLHPRGFRASRIGPLLSGMASHGLRSRPSKPTLLSARVRDCAVAALPLRPPAAAARAAGLRAQGGGFPSRRAAVAAARPNPRRSKPLPAYAPISSFAHRAAPTRPDFAGLRSRPSKSALPPAAASRWRASRRSTAAPPHLPPGAPRPCPRGRVRGTESQSAVHQIHVPAHDDLRHFLATLPTTGILRFRTVPASRKQR